MKRVLTIAGSDSGGGAGIQADLKTFSALGCYGACAITALTAQNTKGVHGIFPVSPGFVVDQIEAVLEDIGADAIKIGMLANAKVIEAVAKCLMRYRQIPLILDPVMVAQSGCLLLESDSVVALREYLFPMALLVTPNLDEAKVLVGEHTMEETAQKILSMGPKSVLVKGGHRDPACYPEAKDYLLSSTGGNCFVAPWIHTKNTHGTGCTLSAAIAAQIAKGDELKEAIAFAKEYLSAALSRGAHMQIGSGAGPVCHNWRML